VPLTPEELAYALLTIRERADDDEHAELAQEQLLADLDAPDAPGEGEGG
jgi:hypothetical protein